MEKISAKQFVDMVMNGLKINEVFTFSAEQLVPVVAFMQYADRADKISITFFQAMEKLAREVSGLDKPQEPNGKVVDLVKREQTIISPDAA